MKEFWKTWQFWVAVVAAVLLIVCIVLWFTCRPFCYAVSGLLIGALAGFIGGYVVGKKNIVQPKAEVAREVKEQRKEQSNAPRRPRW